MHIISYTFSIYVEYNMENVFIILLFYVSREGGNAFHEAFSRLSDLKPGAH